MSIKKVEYKNEPTIGYEKHHIIPRKDGGNDDYENLIYIDTISHEITQGKHNVPDSEMLRVAKELYDKRKDYLNRQGYNLEKLYDAYKNKRVSKEVKERKTRSKRIFTPFTHDGNKSRLFGKNRKYGLKQENFRQYFPKSFEEYNEYIEPFAGSAGVFYELVNDGSLKPEQHHITLNDYDIISYTMHRGCMECNPKEIKEVWKNFELDVKEKFRDNDKYGLWLYPADMKGGTGRPRLDNRSFKMQKDYMDNRWKEIQKDLNKKSYKNPIIVANLLTLKVYSFSGNFYNKKMGTNLNLTRMGNDNMNLMKGMGHMPKYINNLEPLHDKLNEFKDGAGIDFLNCDYKDTACSKLYDVEPFKSFWYIDPPYIGTGCNYESKNINKSGFLELLYKLHEKYAHYTFSIDSGKGGNYDQIINEKNYEVKTGENPKYKKEILKGIDANLKVEAFTIKTRYNSWQSTRSSKLSTQTKDRSEGVMWNWD